MDKVEMNDIVSLAKRRGFIFPGSQIYGGLANTWDYGPQGTLVLQNIKNLWWKRFIETRDDIYPIESGIIANSKVWEASGHTVSFTDPLVECNSCRRRFREDHVEGNLCPDCGGKLSEPKNFNLMFKTHIGPVEEKGSEVFLRPETAQGMFLNFKNILTTERPRLPFGIAQIGRAFRNEISPGNFIFRTLEFEQMEIEYFIRPESWEQTFEDWKKKMWDWLTVDLGIDEGKLRWRAHGRNELSHYSKRTEDIEFEFPFGWGELYGLAYRGDFDLKNHMEKSGEDLNYVDPQKGEKFIPHVIEPTFGVGRTLLALMVNGYKKDEERTVLALKATLAPYKVAVFPLVANKEELVLKAKNVYNDLRLKHGLIAAFDDRGNIGKRYLAQDEIGTPWCVTVDYQTLEDETVTVRDRDSKKQERIPIDKLLGYLQNKLLVPN